MKIKVFTHTDLDGIGSAVLLQALLPEAYIDYEAHGYGSIDAAVSAYFNDRLFVDYDMTFITDISVREEYSIDAIRRMFNLGHKIVLLDHHPTAEPLNQYLWANVVTEKPNCGTTLTLDYIKKAMAEEYDKVDIEILARTNDFAYQVSQWDTWLWTEGEDKFPKQLNDLFYIYGRDEFLDDMVHKLIHAMPLISKDDQKALNIRQKQIDRYIDTKIGELLLVDHAYENLTAGVVFAEEYFSELGHELLREFDEMDYVMMINIGKKTVSLRARDEDDIDVEVIAKSYGGGGHTKASGFRFSGDIYDDCMMDIINSQRRK